MALVPHDLMSLAHRRRRQPGDDAFRSRDGAGRAFGALGTVLKVTPRSFQLFFTDEPGGMVINGTT